MLVNNSMRNEKLCREIEMIEKAKYFVNKYV